MYKVLCLLLDYEADPQIEVDGMPLYQFAKENSAHPKSLEKIKEKIMEREGL